MNVTRYKLYCDGDNYNVTFTFLIELGKAFKRVLIYIGLIIMY